MALATLATFIGACFGKKLIRKITIDTIQMIVGFMLIAVGLLLALGIA